MAPPRTASHLFLIRIPGRRLHPGLGDLIYCSIPNSHESDLPAKGAKKKMPNVDWSMEFIMAAVC